MQSKTKIKNKDETRNESSMNEKNSRSYSHVFNSQVRTKLGLRVQSQTEV